mgnify:CR=1 FL=1
MILIFKMQRQRKKIQDELAKLNLYPTKQELMNICRCYNNKENQHSNNNVRRRSQEPSNADPKVIPLDFTLGQDKQTIVQTNERIMNLRNFRGLLIFSYARSCVAMQ